MSSKIFDINSCIQWLKFWIAKKCKLDISQIHDDIEFSYYGLDSVDSIKLANDLESHVSYKIEPTILFNYPNINKLSAYLDQLLFKPKKANHSQPLKHSLINTSIIDNDVAIIGMACRLPGAENLEEFWQLLLNGDNAISIPPMGHSHYNSNFKGGYLNKLDYFANEFFNISPREAKCIDPQQRILLETCYMALEDTLIPIDSLKGSNIGVFIGISGKEYDQMQSSDNNIYAATGGALSIAANRISYFFDFKGPSIAIDTACSSSLMAVHLASNSLKNQEVNMAIAGGVNLLLSAQNTEKFAAMGFLSPDFHCKTFDESANGYVRSEGVGVVILKPLKSALLDGNRIYAIIKNTVTNQDGHSNGITAPNQSSQEELLNKAYTEANLDTSIVNYIECHGTGTALGDPIEVGAINSIIGENRGIEQICKIGSVKTNIGHLEAAAGIAGLIKLALMVHYKKLVPNLHFNNPNKAIDFKSIPFVVQQKVEDFVTQDIICGINSFGFGGSNVHAIISNNIHKPQPKALKIKFGEYQFLPISAKNGHELKLQCNMYLEYLQNNPNLDFTKLCSVAALNYTHYFNRVGIIAKANLDAIDQLTNIATDRNNTQFIKDPKICFVFTGQGSQWAGVGKQLLKHTIFKKWVMICDDIINEFASFSVLDVFESNDNILLLENSILQPTLITFQIALTEYLHYLGIKPILVIGHSLGELVAAFIAGALSLEQTLKLAVHRGQVMTTVKNLGAMIAINQPPKIIQDLIDNANLNIDIAIINSNISVVVSGLIDDITKFEHILAQKNIDYLNLNTKHAFHSRYIEPLISQLEDKLIDIESYEFKVPMISTTNAEVLNDGDLTANYWATQMRKPVQFAQAIDKSLTYDIDLFIEIGPSSVLINYIQDIISDKSKNINVLGITRKNSDEDFQFMQSLAHLYQIGCEINWNKLYSKAYLEKTPHYKFYKQPYWCTIKNDQSIPLKDINMSKSINVARPQTLSRLISIVANLIQVTIDNIDINKPFIELGADSIIIVNAIKKIQTEFGIKIAIRRLFEDLQTIQKLALFLDKELLNNDTASCNLDHSIAKIQDNSIQIKNIEKSQQPTYSNNPYINQNSSELEKLFNQQLNIMQQQLQLLTNFDVNSNEEVFNERIEEECENNNLSCSIDLNRQAQTSEIIKKPSTETGAWQNCKMDITPLEQKFDVIQQESMQNLINAYTLKTKTSKSLTAKYRNVLADSKASVGFRLSIKEMLYPIVGQKTYGSKLIDVDGNEYIDITMGFGVHLCGYNPEFIIQALNEEISSGIQLGPRSLIVGEVAELISELTGFERVAFSNTGTESVITAIRIARAATNKNKIVIFRGSYHGHSDYALVESYTTDENGNNIPITPGIPSNILDNTIVLEYGEFEELDKIRKEHQDIAAVLVEPVQSRRPDLKPIEFVKELRRLTTELNIALIFDEMVTGFRSHIGGAQAIFGVKADMATYGKIIGGGLPIGIIAGNKKYMDHIDGGSWQYGDNSYPAVERTFFGGTFCQHPTSLATARAILLHLKNQGPQLQETLNQKTAYLAHELNQFFITENVPIKIVYFASLFRFNFQGNFDLLFYYLVIHGVYVWEWRNCFLSTAHTDEDINKIIFAVKQSIFDMKQGKFIK